MARLTLNDAARVNPLEVGRGPNEPSSTDSRPATTRRRNAARSPRAARELKTAPEPTGETTPSGPVSLAGRSLGQTHSRQTALRLDVELVNRLGETTRAGGATVNVTALTVAVLTRHLPATSSAALDLLVDHAGERLRAGSQPAREVNTRIPDPLRARLDELVREAKRKFPAASRSALVSAILAQHLPTDPVAAAEIVLEHRLSQLPHR